MKNQLLITDVAPSGNGLAILIARACAQLNPDTDHWRTSARQALRAAFPEGSYVIHVGGCHIIHERRLCPLTKTAYLVEDFKYGALVARVIEVPADPRSRSRKYEIERGGVPVADFANKLATWALVPVGFWGGKAA